MNLCMKGAGWCFGPGAMATLSSPKTKRLDKRLLGVMQGGDFRVSLIILMFYKPANQDAQQSHGTAGPENF